MEIGRILILAGIALILIGVYLSFGQELPFLRYLGRLPGDIRLEKGNTRFYFPIITSILLSLLATLLLWILNRFR